MRNFFRIARWEYVTRFKSRSFLFSTFILPVLFSLLITLPAFLLNYDEEVSTKLVGVVNLGNKKMSLKLQKRLNKNFRLKNGSPEYIVMPISVSNSPEYIKAVDDLQIIESRKDSIEQAYNDIKELRIQYFNRQNLPNKKYLLQKTYNELQDIRESKDLIEIEEESYKARLDSVFNSEARKAADSLLFKQIINAYLVIPPELIDEGEVEYHTFTPGDLIESGRFQMTINEMVIETRLAQADVNTNQISDWLRPVRLKKYQLQSQGKQEWNFFLEFYGSIIGVVLLFMAIFTSGGFLFSSVLQEKTNRVIEILLSYASSRQIMGGKIFGLGFLGLTQVLIWLGITALFVVLNLFDAGQISYLNLNNALYFLLYFCLGYLLYAAIFVSIGAIFSSEQEAQQINIILRTLAILPVLLVFLMLKEPNSDIIRVLSYIPLLTPYFMIMRISQQGSLFLQLDIYITTLILIVSIIGMVFVAAKVFRMGILMYGKKMNWKEIRVLLRSS